MPRDRDYSQRSILSAPSLPSAIPPVDTPPSAPVPQLPAWNGKEESLSAWAAFTLPGKESKTLYARSDAYYQTGPQIGYPKNPKGVYDLYEVDEKWSFRLGNSAWYHGALWTGEVTARLSEYKLKFVEKPDQMPTLLNRKQYDPVATKDQNNIPLASKALLFSSWSKVTVKLADGKGAQTLPAGTAPAAAPPTTTAPPPVQAPATPAAPPAAPAATPSPVRTLSEAIMKLFPNVDKKMSGGYARLLMETYINSQPNKEQAGKNLIAQVRKAEEEGKLDDLRKQWSDKLQEFCKSAQTSLNPTGSGNPLPQLIEMGGKAEEIHVSLEAAKTNAEPQSHNDHPAPAVSATSSPEEAHRGIIVKQCSDLNKAITLDKGTETAKPKGKESETPSPAPGGAQPGMLDKIKSGIAGFFGSDRAVKGLAGGVGGWAVGGLAALALGMGPVGLIAIGVGAAVAGFGLAYFFSKKKE